MSCQPPAIHISGTEAKLAEAVQIDMEQLSLDVANDLQDVQEDAPACQVLDDDPVNPPELDLSMGLNMRRLSLQDDDPMAETTMLAHRPDDTV